VASFYIDSLLLTDASIWTDGFYPSTLKLAALRFLPLAENATHPLPSHFQLAPSLPAIHPK